MEFNGELNNEFNNSLLSAVRQGDVNVLKSYLSTMTDINIYLNRVYDEPKEIRCTLLMIACLNEHEDMVRTLLQCSKLDLEVLNDISLLEKHQNLWKFENVTVLWAAAATDNFQIVQLLVEHGAQINHTTKTNSTAFRCACYNGNIDMARYLIEKGADCRIAKEHNETNLIASVFNEHLHITTYLVDELNCDLNDCLENGRSPLYFAVDRGLLEHVQFLLSRGARNFRTTHDQLSPLILAAEKRRTDLVEAISPHCSLLEQIEAEELLGSAFACAEHGNCDLEKSVEYFCRALELRSIHHLPKALRLTTIDALDNRQECQTIDQLKDLRSNSDNIYTEALLVRERLLCPSNAKYRHSLRYRGANLADSAQHNRGIVLWLYELELCRQHSISIDRGDLRQFAAMLSDMTFLSLSTPIAALQTVITIVVDELERNTTDFDHNLHTFLFLITIVSQLLSKAAISPTDRKVFYRHVHFAIQRRYVTHAYESSLLHLSLCDRTCSDDHFIDRNCKYPCLTTARVLLQCGADVNATDAARDTPLHVFVSNSNISDHTILQLLCDANAHLDCVNALRETPIDLVINSNVKQFLQLRMKISLKCLCARLIKQHEIPFHGKIAASLINFVEKH